MKKMKIVDAEITDSRSGIDEYVVVDQHGGGTRSPSDTAAATQYSYLHVLKLADPWRRAATRVLMTIAMWDDSSRQR